MAQKHPNHVDTWGSASSMMCVCLCPEAWLHRLTAHMQPGWSRLLQPSVTNPDPASTWSLPLQDGWPLALWGSLLAPFHSQLFVGLVFWHAAGVGKSLFLSAPA